MSDFTSASFSDIEEVGYRLKAARIAERISINTIRDNAMTHVAYNSIEDGRGSINVLGQVAELMNATVQVKLIDASDNVVAETDLENLRSTLIQYRQDNFIARSAVAKEMEVPYASVIVFETSEKPRVRSFSRYIKAIGLRAEYTVLNKDGQPIVPAEILDKDKMKKLRKEFNDSMERDMTEVRTDPRLGDGIKKIREKKGLSKAEVSRLSGIKESSVVKVEMSQTRLSTAAKVAESLGYELRIILRGENILWSDLTSELDKIRVEKGYTPSDFARQIGTTYRTVKIFPNSGASMASIMRYVDGLGINIRYKFEKLSKNENS